MGWVKLSERKPPKFGYYLCIAEMESEMSGFLGIGKKKLKERRFAYSEWGELEILESKNEKQVIYVREIGFRKWSCDKITHWYELDPMPEEI